MGRLVCFLVFLACLGEISRRRPTAAALHHWPKQTLALIKSDRLGAEPLGRIMTWSAITPSCPAWSPFSNPHAWHPAGRIQILRAASALWADKEHHWTGLISLTFFARERISSVHKKRERKHIFGRELLCYLLLVCSLPFQLLSWIRTNVPVGGESRRRHDDGHEVACWCMREN